MRHLSYLFLSAVALLFVACGTDSSTAVQAPLAEVVKTLFGYDEAPLAEIRQEISEVPGKDYSRLVAYWTAYTDFQTAIFRMKTNDKAGSEAVARRGIATLEAVSGKNAEELALQSFIEGFVIQFTDGVESARAAQVSAEHIAAAHELNPDNLRVQYVMGSMDYYTPAEYGGGEQAEQFLTRAITLPEQTGASSALPTWGKAGAYELLVRHYSNAADAAKAERFLQEGLDKYPNDYLLTAMAHKQ